MVLDKVNGTLFPGTMTAILGPSGCGKTSFLTALAGRAYYGKITGQVKINGVEQPISKFRTVAGFVPQEDIMIRTLTVRQTLTFSARMRLPRSMSDAAKLRVVDAVLHVLGLEDLQNQVIGDGKLPSFWRALLSSADLCCRKCQGHKRWPAQAR
jgi:ABC-type multidrug transport system ATPase subunit